MSKISQLILWAHSFYPDFCCGERDCKSISCSELVQENGRQVYRFLSHVYKVVATTEFYASPNAACHVCLAWSADAGEFIRCLWIPQGIS